MEIWGKSHFAKKMNNGRKQFEHFADTTTIICGGREYEKRT
jgi:hypothetical protein